MPNHVQNVLHIGAETDARLHEIFEAIRGAADEDGEPCFIDFEKIIPMPSCLKIGDVTCIDESIPLSVTKEELFEATLTRAFQYGWQKSWGLEDDAKEFMKKIAARVDRDYEARQVFAENVAKTGFKSWYDWSYTNWGTKWNAYEQEKSGSNCIRFWTAWAPPIPVIKALSEKFPDVDFELEYVNEDISQQVGSQTFRHGTVVEEVNYPYGHDCINLACDIWGYDDYDRARYHCWYEGIDPDEHPEALEK